MKTTKQNKEEKINATVSRQQCNAVIQQNRFVYNLTSKHKQWVQNSTEQITVPLMSELQFWLIWYIINISNANSKKIEIEK